MQGQPQALEDKHNKDNLAALRQSLQSGLLTIKKEFQQNSSISRLFQQHCALVDSMLINLWSKLKTNTDCCLIAVGGYGRGELYPYSDIDLMLLIPDSPTPNASLNQEIEYFIGLMWDIGLNVGHSVRSLEECITEAEKDVTVQTNLLESRLLAGSSLMYENFASRTRRLSAPLAFFEAKLKEQQKRYAKFNDTAYNLEPNIKESPGGLRDLHMISWLAHTLNLSAFEQQFAAGKTTNIWKLLSQCALISDNDATQIRQHERKLQNIRIQLHYLSGRREDRLLFDFQNELATTLGYRNTPRKRASEQLMQSYYRSAKYIELMNEILLKEIKQKLSAGSTEILSINAEFESRNHLLECKNESLLTERPAAIFDAFLLLQQHPELHGMGPSLLRKLQLTKHLVNRSFRQSRYNKQRFIEILSQPISVNHTLRAMNRYGILGRYIPAFGRIIGQMQHDLFHVYTVDEHILNVLANLRRFSKPELKHEFPLCSQLFAAFDAPYLLYLAALFHDIAKGRNGDHSDLGKVDAARFCQLHELPKEDAALVSWLVETHLKMSATAQKSDLSDPNVIEGFANLVGNERRLTALYLLTVADIRGTSPMVWNAWKARLLESLYHETKHALNAPAFHTKQVISRRIEEASEKLLRFGISQKTFETMWREFGENYFVRHETDEIAWQSRLLTPHLHTETPIVRARLSSYGDGIQVMIYTKDQNDIFARICNFFDRMSYNIVSAKIYTTQHDYALDSFIILGHDNKSISYNGLLNFIETQLTEKLNVQHALESPLKGRVSRQVKHMPIQAQVSIKDDPEHNQTMLDLIANDRPGLLATVAQVFLQHNIALHNAKINTLGNRVEDSFLLSARNGQKLSDEQIEALQQSLLRQI